MYVCPGTLTRMDCFKVSGELQAMIDNPNEPGGDNEYFDETVNDDTSCITFRAPAHEPCSRL